VGRADEEVPPAALGQREGGAAGEGRRDVAAQGNPRLTRRRLHPFTSPVHAEHGFAMTGEVKSSQALLLRRDGAKH